MYIARAPARMLHSAPPCDHSPTKWYRRKTPHFVHTADYRLSCECHNKQPLFPCTAFINLFIMKMYRVFFLCEEGSKPLCIKHVRFNLAFKSHRFPLTSYLSNTSLTLPVTQNISVDARHRCGLLVNTKKATLSTQSLAAPTDMKHGIFNHTHRLFPAFKNSRSK